jgi:hypothetical protein
VVLFTAGIHASSMQYAAIVAGVIPPGTATVMTAVGADQCIAELAVEIVYESLQVVSLSLHSKQPAVNSAAVACFARKTRRCVC